MIKVHYGPGHDPNPHPAYFRTVSAFGNIYRVWLPERTLAVFPAGRRDGREIHGLTARTIEDRAVEAVALYLQGITNGVDAAVSARTSFDVLLDGGLTVSTNVG